MTPTPTDFEKADDYKPGTRIVSKFTRRKGTVADSWPGNVPILGAVYVNWDDGHKGHAWRHQINRLV
jgi:hypothetical protein